MKKFFTLILMATISSWLLNIPAAQAQQPCIAGFTFAIGTNSPSGVQVAFYDSSWSGGVITNWNWSFGNGTGSTQQNPTTTLMPGTYYVCLSITAMVNNQSCTSQYCDTLVITGGTLPCFANFTSTVSPGSAQFSATGSGNTQWLWDFGDGNTSTLQNPNHAYASPGTYNVCLDVVTSGGQQCTSCQSIIVPGTSSCAASFTSNQVPGTNTFNFTNTSTGNALNYLWTFGDGNTSSQINPSHTYNSTGYFLVCLVISDSTQSCFDMYCDSVYVQSGSGCNANFTFQNNPSGTLFSASQAGAVGYTWDFGDGNTGTGASLVHAYAPGTYNACLTVTMNGMTCTSCQSVTIPLNALCSSNFTVFPDSSQQHTYIAYNMATGAAPLTYLWNWGDSTTSTGAFPSHTYSAPGLYTICLTITDANGCTSTTCNPYQLLRLSSAVPVTINVVQGFTGINEIKDEATVNVYPVPATSQVTVSIKLEQQSKVSNRLYNTAGQVVLETVVQSLTPGKNDIILDVEKLPSGIYYLETRIDETAKRSKITVQ